MTLLDLSSSLWKGRSKEAMTRKLTQFAKEWKEAVNTQESPFSIINASFDSGPSVWESSSDLAPAIFRYSFSLKQPKHEFEWDTLLSDR